MSQEDKQQDKNIIKIDPATVVFIIFALIALPLVITGFTG
jgi:preprotein translocase subunit Sec61beta